MRVSFAGGGTDLPPFFPGVGGRIVGSAIDLTIRALVEPFDPGWIKLELPSMDRSLVRRSEEPASEELAFRLLEAALADRQVEGGVHLRVETSMVPGAGLGGSAAAAVAIMAALSASASSHDDPSEIDREELSSAALHIERDGLHLACGAQDPLFATFGGVLDLRFDEEGKVERNALSVPADLLHEFGEGLLLIDTGKRRVSGDVLRKTPSRVEVNRELVAAASDVVNGFTTGSLDEILKGMRRNAAAKAQKDPVANAIALDLATRLSPLGACVVRMCGAGAGGHVLVWALPDTHAKIEAAVHDCTVRKPKLAAPGVEIEVE